MEQPIIEVDGRRMKKCPGWSGNNGRCGRGNPRLIPEKADVCENCSRGMRKAGQKTREQEEMRLKRRQRRIAEASRGAEKAQASMDSAIPKETLLDLIEAIESLRGSDIDPALYSSGYAAKETIGAEGRWEVLRMMAGLEPAWKSHE